MSSRKIAVIALFGLMAAALVAIGFSFVNQIACEGQPIKDNVNPSEAQQIWGERIIGQSFVAPRNGLHRIDLLFQTYQRQNTGQVTLRLLEVPDNENNPLQGLERFQTDLNAATVRDQSWRTFTFPAISDSAGKSYLITLESPEATDGNAISVGGIQQNVYGPGSAFLGPVPVPADMTFRTCYQLTFREKLEVLAIQLTRNRPAMWGDPLFYGLILLLYGLLLIGFFWKLTQLALDPSSDEREEL